MGFPVDSPSMGLLVAAGLGTHIAPSLPPSSPGHQIKMHLSRLFYSPRGPLTASCHQPCPGDTGKGGFMYFMLNCWSLYFLCSRAVAQGTMRVAEDGAGWVSSKRWGWRFPQQREMGEEEEKKKALRKSFFPVNRFLPSLFSEARVQTYTHKRTYTHTPATTEQKLDLLICLLLWFFSYFWVWNAKQESVWTKPSNLRPLRMSFKQG